MKTVTLVILTAILTAIVFGTLTSTEYWKLNIENGVVSAYALPAENSTNSTIQTKVESSNNLIDVSTVGGKKNVSTYSDTIMIKNNSNSTLNSIRIMLSPEISRSFHLDTNSIRSIQPYGNATVEIKLFGNPNRDPYGKVSAYEGKIIVTAPNHNPVVLPLNIISIDSMSYQVYREMVGDMTLRHYNRISLMKTILERGATERSDIEVTNTRGFSDTNTSTDMIVIKNLSNRTLSNVRIMLSNAGNAFLLDKYNIQLMEPNSQVVVKMIPKMDRSKYSPKDYVGEIIVGADNALPRAIGIHIPAANMHDSKEEFEVRSTGNEIASALDTIYINNTGNRSMDSVKIMLSGNLARVLFLSNHSFHSIEPGEEVPVAVRYNTKDLKTFMQNLSGTINVVSEHHNMRSIPVKIQWNKLESDNFVVFARNDDQNIAGNLLKHLENIYKNVTKSFGTVNHKATIYLIGSMEEMQLLNDSGQPFYSYSNDAIFVCSCNAMDDAMQGFIYRAIMQNFPTYSNMNKIDNDHGNWLIDGIAKYETAKNNQSLSKYIDAFKKEPAGFWWYGSPADSEYGATVTFFTYLEETYGEDVIYRTLYHLGSSMVSNYKCNAVEDCAVLRGVYDASGMDMDKKRFTLDFRTLTNDWKDYVKALNGVVIEDGN